MNPYNIQYFETLESTNNYAKTHANYIKDKTVIVAKKQTQGYGRLKREWLSSNDDNLTFSICLRLQITETLPLLTQLTAVSLVKTLEKHNINTMIKWPNDILVHHKKICGILIETQLTQDEAFVIIGIGLNVNQTEFDISIKNKATSLINETNKKYQPNKVLISILENFEPLLKQYQNDNHSYLEVCRNNNYLLNKDIEVDGKTGRCIGINDQGQLLVDINNEIKSYNGSEVTLTNIYLTGEEQW